MNYHFVIAVLSLLILPLLSSQILAMMEEDQASINPSFVSVQRTTSIDAPENGKKPHISTEISSSQEESSLLNNIMEGSEVNEAQLSITENKELDETLLYIFENKSEQKRHLEDDTLTTSERKTKKKRISIPKFKVALLNSSIVSYEGALCKEEGISSHRIRGGIPGAIFFKKEEVRAAPWVSILLESVEPSAAELPIALSANTEKIDSGIVFIEENGKKFAFPFGKGHHLLRKEALDHEFGLRVALNAINPEKIKSLGCQTIDYNPKLTFTSYNRLWCTNR